MANNITEMKKGKRGLPVKPLQPGDMSDLIELALSNIHKGGMPKKYEDDEQGLQEFITKSKDYFQAIAAQNRAVDDPAQMLIPSVEMWACFLGISRMTLVNYERRSDEWGNAINFFKTVIYSVKNELAAHGKLSPVLLIFDSVNNYSYRNVAEFKLEPVKEKETLLTNMEDIQKRLPKLADQDSAQDTGTEVLTLDDFI